MKAARQPVITRANTGVEHGHAGGAHSFTALSAEQNPGGVAVQFGTMPEGSGPPFHRHPSFDEVFIILEGAVEFQANDRLHTLHPGDLIHIPGEVPHAPRCVSGPARIVMLVTPARFERFFHELGDAIAAGGRDAMEALGREYGIEFVDRPAIVVG